MEEAVDDPGVNSTTLKVTYATPPQDDLKECISLLEAELDVVIRRRDSISSDGKEQAQIPKLRKDIDSKKKELHNKQLHKNRSLLSTSKKSSKKNKNRKDMFRHELFNAIYIIFLMASKKLFSAKRNGQFCLFFQCDTFDFAVNFIWYLAVYEERAK